MSANQPRTGLGWTGMASILRLLQLQQATVPEIIARCSAHENTVRDAVHCMRAMKLVHVAAWSRRAPPASGHREVWGFGAGPDAPHPSPRHTRAADPRRHMRSSVIAMAYVVRALEKPVSKAYLEAISGADRATVRKFLDHAQTIGLVRVAGWSKHASGGQPMALWCLGDGPSVERPPLKTRAEMLRDSRRRRRARELSAELEPV